MTRASCVSVSTATTAPGLRRDDTQTGEAGGSEDMPGCRLGHPVPDPPWHAVSGPNRWHRREPGLPTRGSGVKGDTGVCGGSGEGESESLDHDRIDAGDAADERVALDQAQGGTDAAPLGVGDVRRHSITP